MAFNAKEKEFSGNSNFKAPEPLEVGAYPARLVQLIDLGVQEQRPFKGEPKPPAQEIMTTYEFVDEFLKDDEGNDIEDKPRWLSENFVLHNLESERARSTSRYYALDPDCDADGDWAQLLGKPCMVNIVQNKGTGKNAGKVFNNIDSTSTIRKKEASKMPELVNPPKIFSPDDLDTVEVFFTLPQWLQDKIKAGLEFEGSAMERAIASFKKKDEGEEKKGKKEEPKKQKAAAKEEAEEDGEEW